MGGNIQHLCLYIFTSHGPHTIISLWRSIFLSLHRACVCILRYSAHNKTHAALQSLHHCWNKLSAAHPVASCGKYNTDTTRVMILIHTAAIHISVCIILPLFISSCPPKANPRCTYYMASAVLRNSTV